MEVSQIIDKTASRRSETRITFLKEFLMGAIVMLGLVLCYRGVAGAFSEPVSLSLGLAGRTSSALSVQPAAISPFFQTSTRHMVWVPEAKLRKRDRQGERHRIYNKAIKSAVKTRTKKALRAIDEAKKEGISTEADLQASDKLMSEAYKEIDKAITKGVMKKNTGARQKSRIATWRKKLLIENGLYSPEAVSA
mmetsp:Transcript_17015/g.23823  ORF Transcript_17015/g.23823 Transcript_17015/m.23823 type:complete len:193 (+) Transcript_17015:27-605(+)